MNLPESVLRQSLIPIEKLEIKRHPVTGEERVACTINLIFGVETPEEKEFLKLIKSKALEVAESYSKVYYTIEEAMSNHSSEWGSYVELRY